MTDAAPVSTTAPATDAAAVNPNKVFAGNLNFSATEDDIRKLFGQAGSVTEVQLITRGTRTLGYGFVTFSTADEAQKAIQTLNNKEIDGRVMSVDLAKPQTTTPTPKPAKTRKPRSAAASKEPKEVAATATNGATEGAKENGTSAPRKRRPRTRATPAPEGAEGATEGAARPARKPKKRTQTRVATKEASTTQLFIGNLPADATEATLRELFAGFKVTEAKVSAARAKGAAGTTTGKLYGFVTLESEEEQQRALSAKQGSSLGGNELNVKVAIKTTYSKKPAAEADGSAPAEAAAAPAAEATA